MLLILTKTEINHEKWRFLVLLRKRQHLTIFFSLSIDPIDIVKDPIPPHEYKAEEDPKLYKSVKTRRGPLSEDWIQEYKNNPGKYPIMCAYKLCKVEFRYWGMQSKIERFIHDVGEHLWSCRVHPLMFALNWNMKVRSVQCIPSRDMSVKRFSDLMILWISSEKILLFYHLYHSVVCTNPNHVYPLKRFQVLCRQDLAFSFLIFFFLKINLPDHF